MVAISSSDGLRAAPSGFPRSLVVGVGAVGGYIGARLAQASRDVTFLARARRTREIERDGLRIVSPHGDAVLHPRLVRPRDLDAPFDLVILAVKGHSLAQAMEDMAPAVGSDTVILPLLNGMRHVDELASRFGRARLLGGACRLATQLDDAGCIRQLAPLQQIAYGELDGRRTPRVEAVHAAMQGTGFEAELSPDIVLAMWDKWVQLASLGAVTCLFRGPIGAVVAAPGGAELAEAIVSECVTIAIACGHPPSPTFLNAHREAMTRPGSPMTSSMFRDLMARSPVEADRIIDDLVRLGDSHGIDAPMLSAASVNLRVYRDGLDREARDV